MKSILTIISLFFACLAANAQTADFHTINIEPDNEITSEIKNYHSYEWNGFILYIGFSSNNLKAMIKSAKTDEVKFEYDETSSDAMIIKPQFFESSDKKTMVIMLELAAEYSWGQKLVMIRNGNVYDCGYLDYMTNEGNGESIAKYAKLKEINGQIILTFQPMEFVDRDEQIIQSETLTYSLHEGCNAQGETKPAVDTILPNGKYRFDIAFAEWQGKSMGEKVTVIIKGDSIQVIYEGDGQLTGGKGVLENGKIMKHKSGVWIISNDPSDIQLDEIGGCTGGPSIIDFKNKKYWMC